jgi:hypothetical protein
LQALYARALSDARQHNIVCTGDLERGEGSGFGFAARYVVDETHITIHVTRKPFIVPAARIEKAVRDYVSGK